MVGPSTSIFKIFVSILLDESRTESNAEKKRETESEEEPIIVMLGSQQRAVPELGRVPLSPDTTSGAGEKWENTKQHYMINEHV